MILQRPISIECDALGCFYFGLYVQETRQHLEAARKTRQKQKRAELLILARRCAERARTMFKSATAGATFYRAKARRTVPPITSLWIRHGQIQVTQRDGSVRTYDASDLAIEDGALLAGHPESWDRAAGMVVYRGGIKLGIAPCLAPTSALCPLTSAL